MQGNNQGTGNTNGQKHNGPVPSNQSGLSWTQPAAGAAQPQTPPAAKPVMPLAAQTAPKQGASKGPQSPKNGGSSMRTAGLFIGGVVVAGLIVWAFVGMRSGSDNNAQVADTASSTQATTTTPSSNPAKVSNITKIPAGGTIAPGTTATSQFSVEDQKAGSSVTVTGVRVSLPTWFVVYEDSSGKPGNALGAAMAFPENNGKSITVPLLRPTMAGRTYRVGQSADNGDHVFSLQSDPKILDTAGALITMSFQGQ